ncbi:MAG: bifunctional methionine sulfoxide reductase B/A protein [Saprospiraceae bacterium]
MDKRNPLSTEEARVILNKGTERAFTGEYWDHKIDGVYICRQCEAPLYDAKAKFDSGCGWPSFDDELPGAVKRHIDADGRRTEIVCANCDGHLGHVFIGERMTEKNTRHCVNSLSMKFINRAKWEELKPAEKVVEKAVFAAGCFWSKEYTFSRITGVVATRVGFTGGHTTSPTYQEVCNKTTGHAEAVEVTYDPSILSFEELARLFFEMHDPTIDRREKGGQYRSAIFYQDESQKKIAEQLIQTLQAKGYDVVTQLEAAAIFWSADARHQKYCDSHGLTPTSHREARF